MKVLQENPWKHEFNCSGCKSRLEADTSDVRVGRFGGYDESETRWYCDCTVCGTRHFLEKDLPPKVLEAAHKNSKSSS